MTKILVTYATKMGATKGIAEEIAHELHRTFSHVRISDAARRPAAPIGAPPPPLADAPTEVVKR